MRKGSDHVSKVDKKNHPEVQHSRAQKIQNSKKPKNQKNRNTQKPDTHRPICRRTHLNAPESVSDPESDTLSPLQFLEAGVITIAYAHGRTFYSADPGHDSAYVCVTCTDEASGGVTRQRSSTAEEAKRRMVEQMGEWKEYLPIMEVRAFFGGFFGFFLGLVWC